MTDEKDIKVETPLEMMSEETKLEPGSMRIDGSGGISVAMGGGSLGPLKWEPVVTPATTSSSPTTYSSGGVLPATLTFPAAKKPKPSKTLDAPSKSPRKILVAFLNEDDEVEWCGKVHPGDIQVDFDKGEFAPRMTLGFFLIEAE